jgi:hypothetical protein
MYDPCALSDHNSLVMHYYETTLNDLLTKSSQGVECADELTHISVADDRSNGPIYPLCKATSHQPTQKTPIS